MYDDWRRISLFLDIATKIHKHWSHTDFCMSFVALSSVVPHRPQLYFGSDNVLKNVCLIAHCFFTYLVVLFRFDLFGESLSHEYYPLILASLSGWLHMIFMFRGVNPGLGQLIIILEQIILRDLARFIVVWGLLKICFTEVRMF